MPRTYPYLIMISFPTFEELTTCAPMYFGAYSGRVSNTSRTSAQMGCQDERFIPAQSLEHISHWKLSDPGTPSHSGPKFGISLLAQGNHPIERRQTNDSLFWLLFIRICSVSRPSTNYRYISVAPDVDADGPRILLCSSHSWSQGLLICRLVSNRPNCESMMSALKRIPNIENRTLTPV